MITEDIALELSRVRRKVEERIAAGFSGEDFLFEAKLTPDEIRRKVEDEKVTLFWNEHLGYFGW